MPATTPAQRPLAELPRAQPGERAYLRGLRRCDHTGRDKIISRPTSSYGTTSRTLSTRGIAGRNRHGACGTALEVTRHALYCPRSRPTFAADDAVLDFSMHNRVRRSVGFPRPPEPGSSRRLPDAPRGNDDSPRSKRLTLLGRSHAHRGAPGANTRPAIELN